MTTIEELVAQRKRIERAAKRRQLTGEEFATCQRLSMEIRRRRAETGTTLDARMPWELTATAHDLSSAPLAR